MQHIKILSKDIKWHKIPHNINLKNLKSQIKTILAYSYIYIYSGFLVLGDDLSFWY